jgi:hypothetical protein
VMFHVVTEPCRLTEHGREMTGSDHAAPRDILVGRLRKPPHPTGEAAVVVL